MTLNEILGESLAELAELKDDHPVLVEMCADPNFVNNAHRFAEGCAGATMAQIILSCLAVGITIGRKTPEVVN